MATVAKAKASSTASGELTCPECGRTFARPQALGAHRRQAHGVAGTSRNTTRRRAQASAAPTRTNGGGTRSAVAAAATDRRSRRSLRPARSAGAGSNGAGRRIDRDALLQTVFPGGIPPRQEVIAAANAWLDEAERLAGLR